MTIVSLMFLEILFALNIDSLNKLNISIQNCVKSNTQCSMFLLKLETGIGA